MSALAAALAVSGETETLISRNQRDGAKAQAAAEAGLSHAVELATTFIFSWSNNGFGSADAAVDSLLSGPDLNPADTADNGGLDERTGIAASEDIPKEGDPLPIAGALNVSYTAFLTDDDATAPAASPENGDGADDGNKTIVVRSTGFGPDGTRVTLEAVLTAFPFPAVATNDDIDLDGSFSVLGSSGSVHTNGNLTGSGTSGTVDEMATAVGSYTYSNPSVDGYGGVGRMTLPPVNAADYLGAADFILKDDRTLVDTSTGSVICTAARPATECNGWKWQNSTSSWFSNSGTIITGTYYVETDIDFNGIGPVAMTVISEGDITIGGSPQFWADTPGVVLIADKDIKIAGTPGTTIAEGVIRAHEQIELSGNASISGSIMAEDAANDSSTVTANSIQGSVVITYNGGLNGDMFTVSGWRDVR